jgi:acyl transferase domain-containing protein
VTADGAPPQDTDTDIARAAPPFRENAAPLPLVLRAQSPGNASAAASLLRHQLQDRPWSAVRNLGRSLAADDSDAPYRAVVLATPGTLEQRLTALAAQRKAGGIVQGSVGDGKIAMVFPGHMQCWPGMACDLIAASPLFADKMADCAAAMALFVDWPLFDVLAGAPNAPTMDTPDVAQPALFATMVSLAELWRACGIEPDMVVGHSLGEVAAVHVAGGLSLSDAMQVVCLLGRRQRSLFGQGEMLWVRSPEVEIDKLLSETASSARIAAVNGPKAVLVSGAVAAMDELVTHLRERHIHSRRLDIGCAIHTPLVDTLLPWVTKELTLHPQCPRTPLYTALFGGLASEDTDFGIAYWCQNMRSQMRFHEAMTAAYRDGCRIAIEVSPHPVLTSSIEEIATAAGVPTFVSGTLRKSDGGADRFLYSLAGVFAHGAKTDWSAIVGAAPQDAGEVPADIRAALDQTVAAQDTPRLPQPQAVAAAKDARVAVLTELVCSEAATVLGGVRTVEPDVAFADIGFDSVTAISLSSHLTAVTGLHLPATLLFDFPTASAVARFMATSLSGDLAEQAAVPPTPSAVSSEPIAIVGMACRFAGADNPQQFWRILVEGRDAVVPLPADRGWDATERYDPTLRRPGTFYQREGGYLRDAPGFDAAFFGISPREALVMDPQHRILLETSWEAIESAGINPLQLRGSRTGVFAGLIPMSYGPRADESTPEMAGHVLTGSAGSVASGRISYVLGLEGPALTVDTACSSSLVAVHLAMAALRRGECDLALAGGATVLPNLALLVGFSRQRALAPDGRCKAFAAAADGFGLAEGSGIVVLERLSLARQRGHRVLAVLRGSAVNQDGASNGLTAPNGPSQQRVILAALADAGVRPDDVDAVEAHGTGTHLGDPIEAQALQATYGRTRPTDQPLWLGSVKSNIGHAQAAAGVAGLIKMVCALQAGILPATLHVDRPSTEIDWSADTVRLLTSSREWTAAGRPRRAGVSAFGISGTNAHVIVEEAPPAPVEQSADASKPSDSQRFAWIVSARDDASLQRQAERLRERFAADPTCHPADIATTLAGRAALPCRAVLIGGPPVLRHHLDILANGGSAGIRPQGDAVQGRLALMFTGQGSQRVGMGQQLYHCVPAFADAFDEVCAALDPHLDRPVREVIWGDSDLLNRTSYTQAALFAIEAALFRLFQTWGVQPDYVIGHSVGELTAAYAAGVFSLSDAAALVAARGRLMQALPAGGVMVAVEAAEREVAPLLSDLAERVSIAAVNGPSSVVVSGERGAVDEVVRTLERDKIPCRPLNVSHAFHSPLMEPMLTAFSRVAEGITFHEPTLPVISNLTGRLAEGSDLRTPEYWVRHVRSAVRYHEGVVHLHDLGVTAFAELGPGGTLAGLTRTCLPDLDSEAVIVAALRDGRDEMLSLLHGLGELWVNGYPVDWASASAVVGGSLVDLPTYPFQQKRYWLDSTSGYQQRPVSDGRVDLPFWVAVDEQNTTPLCELLGVEAGDRFDTVVPAMRRWFRQEQDLNTVNGWRYRIGWSALAAPSGVRLEGRWLLILPAGGVLDPIVNEVGDCVRDAGATLTEIMVADSDDLLAQLIEAAAVGRPAGVVSVLGLDRRPHPEYPHVSTGVASTLQLAKCLVKAQLMAPLWCLTQGAVSTGPTDPPADPAAAQLWGMSQVIGLELPEHWGGLIDLPAGFDRGSCREALTAVLGGVMTEDQVALRAAGVLGRRLRSAALPRLAPPRWRPRGTALITGGTGALGGHVARWLASHGADHIVLTSRRGEQAPGVAKLSAELTALGAEVTVVGTDLADRAACAELVDEIRRRHGPIRTVVHAAGVLRAAELVDATLDDFSAMAAGKLIGAYNLDEILDDAEVDAFVLFSSITGVLGRHGLAGYAAVNAGVAAIAERRRARGASATAIAWGMWAGGGMVTDKAAHRLELEGIRGMDPAHATLALHQALDQDEALVWVADVDWRAFLPGYTFASPRPLVTELPEAKDLLASDRADQETDRQPAGTLAQRLSGLSLPERQDLVLRIVREQAARVLRHDDVAAVPANQTFRDLGFESLTVREFSNHLRVLTGSRLPASALFDYPTPALLAAELLRRLTPAAEEAAEEPDAQVRAAIAEIPIDRLREAGLLDTLLRFAGRDELSNQLAEGQEPAEARGIDDLDAEDLIQLALGRQ